MGLEKRINSGIIRVVMGKNYVPHSEGPPKLKESDSLKGFLEHGVGGLHQTIKHVRAELESLQKKVKRRSKSENLEAEDEQR